MISQGAKHKQPVWTTPKSNVVQLHGVQLKPTFDHEHPAILYIMDSYPKMQWYYLIIKGRAIPSDLVLIANLAAQQADIK